MLGFLAFAAIIILDQITKFLTVQHIPLHQSGAEIIPGILGLYHTTNTGGGWSILEGNVFFLIVMPICVCGVIVYLLLSKKIAHPFFKWSLIFILSGAVGNLIDRIFNSMHVVDMLNFLFVKFPIFNVADIFISIGAVMRCMYVLFIEKTEEKKDGEN